MVPPRDSVVAVESQVYAWSDEDDPANLSDEELVERGVSREALAEYSSDEDDDLTDEELAELERRVEEAKRGKVVPIEVLFAKLGIERKSGKNAPSRSRSQKPHKGTSKKPAHGERRMALTPTCSSQR